MFYYRVSRTRCSGGGSSKNTALLLCARPTSLHCRSYWVGPLKLKLSTGNGMLGFSRPGLETHRNTAVTVTEYVRTRRNTYKLDSAPQWLQRTIPLFVGLFQREVLQIWMGISYLLFICHGKVVWSGIIWISYVEIATKFKCKIFVNIWFSNDLVWFTTQCLHVTHTLLKISLHCVSKKNPLLWCP